jgi:hypothetical protein
VPARANFTKALFINALETSASFSITRVDLASDLRKRSRVAAGSQPLGLQASSGLHWVTPRRAALRQWERV